MGGNAVELKVNIDNLKNTKVRAESEKVFANKASKAFADFKLQTTSQNEDAYKKQLALASSTKRSVKSVLKKQHEELELAQKGIEKAQKKKVKARKLRKKAEKEVVSQRTQSKKLMLQPLPAMKRDPNERAAKADKAGERARKKSRKNIARLKVKLAFKKAENSGKAKDMTKATLAMERFESGAPAPTKAKSVGIGAKCFGKQHQSPTVMTAHGSYAMVLPPKAKDEDIEDLGESATLDDAESLNVAALVNDDQGTLTCVLPEGKLCVDKVTPAGVFVPIDVSGVGYCAPWTLANATSMSARGGGATIIKHDAPHKGKLGHTFVVKMGVFHPDTAKKNVGMLAFKRTVCVQGKCDVFWAARCMKCVLDDYTSTQQSKATPMDNLNFLQRCALPLMKKHPSGTLPTKHTCDGNDLLSAQRSLIEW